MRKSRFTEEQIVGALREHETGASPKELCRRLGIATETLYNWKRKYGGMDVSEARRLRMLEEENSRLKRLVADLSLDNRALKDVLAKTSDARRPAAGGVLCGGVLDVLRATRLRAGGHQPVELPLPGKRT